MALEGFDYALQTTGVLTRKGRGIAGRFWAREISFTMPNATECRTLAKIKKKKDKLHCLRNACGHTRMTELYSSATISGCKLESKFPWWKPIMARSFSSGSRIVRFNSSGLSSSPAAMPTPTLRFGLMDILVEIG